MSKINRRTAMVSAVATGASVATLNTSLVAQENKQEKEQKKEPELTQDQKFVVAAGLTKEEADCWKKTAEAAGAFFNLPELHPMDKQEVAMAIHVLQNKLLGRPTYRKYVKLAKAGRKEK